MPGIKISKENENEMHFLTLTAIEWIDIFTKPQYFHAIIESLKFCRSNKGLKLYEYVIMVNHLHLIVREKAGLKLSDIIRDFKRHTTKEIIKLLEKDNRRYVLNLINNSFTKNPGNKKQIWQNNNYPEVIITDKFLRQKINYIYENPVKKEYVVHPQDWLYSSAHNRILNDNSVINLDDPWI